MRISPQNNIVAHCPQSFSLNNNHLTVHDILMTNAIKEENAEPFYYNPGSVVIEGCANTAVDFTGQ